tara:strand:- start:557 stop:1267 length:711 start_codon:yes stop_codon:yes gene_type:complete
MTMEKAAVPTIHVFPIPAKWQTKHNAKHLAVSRSAHVTQATTTTGQADVRKILACPIPAQPKTKPAGITTVSPNATHQLAMTTIPAQQIPYKPESVSSQNSLTTQPVRRPSVHNNKRVRLVSVKAEQQQFVTTKIPAHVTYVIQSKDASTPRTTHSSLMMASRVLSMYAIKESQAIHQMMPVVTTHCTVLAWKPVPPKTPTPTPKDVLPLKSPKSLPTQAPVLPTVLVMKQAKASR